MLWSESQGATKGHHSTRISRQAASTMSAERQCRLAKSLTLAAMGLGYAVVQLDVTVVNTALSSIGASLGGGVTELQWVVSSYTTAFAALILTAGALGDRIGAKRIFVAGFALFTTASLAFALAPTAPMLIGSRVLQGVGAAILVPNSLALLNHAYPKEKDRGRAVGVWAAGASLALTAGPLAGGSLIALVGWRSIFLVNLPIGLAAIWLTWRYATETTRLSGRKIDWAGQAAGTGGLGCLVGAIIEGGVSGWSGSLVLGCSAIALLLSAFFIFREQRTLQPMLPLSLFRNRCFSVASLIGLLVNVAFYGMIFVLSLYFQQVNGLSPFATGLAFLPMTSAVLPANLLAARASECIGARLVIAAGSMIAALGCLALISIEPKMSYWIMVAQLVAMGAGLGLLVPPLTSLLLGSVEKSRSGLAAGVLNSTRQAGSVLGVALFGSLISHADTFMPGVRESLIISVTMLLCACAAILSVVRREGERAS